MGRKYNKKRADGRISSQVYLGVVNGKRKYKTVYGKTQNEVDEKVFDVKLQLKKGIDISEQRKTFDFWASCWLKSKKGMISHGRYVSLSSKLKYFSSIKDIPLIDLTVFDLQDCLNAHDNLAFSTLKEARQVVNNIFKFAIANRVTDYNPAEFLVLPTAAHTAKVRRALTKREQLMIVETPHKVQRIAMILLFAGLRRGEVIPLEWDDVFFDKKEIRVNKSVEMIGNSVKVKFMTKTKAGMRCVAIPDILVDYLKSEREKELDHNMGEHHLVCPSAHGVIMTPSAWRSLWNSYMLELDLKYGDDKKKKISKYTPKVHHYSIDVFTAHNLRHTYASMLYQAGIDVLTAKEQLGHSDVRTTLNIYTHLDSQFKKRSMDKLNDYFEAD